MVDVSVVMSVYDEPEHVQKTIQSVLAQENVDLEFIIVSDGASAPVLSVLDRYRSNARVTVVEQVNQGLTKALISACEIAKGAYIARIDAGDIMADDRLFLQLSAFKGKPELGIVSSNVLIETIEGYPLYKIEHTQAMFNNGLRAQYAEQIISPFHASVMFRKQVYESVGGYRKEFYFTQDVDLWTRMIECSEIEVINKVLTTGIFSASGISGKYRVYQTKLVELIAKANRLRQQGKVEDTILEQAELLRPGGTDLVQKESKFNSLYFLAKVLSSNKSRHAKEYWWQAILSRPFSIKSWLFYLLSLRYSNG